MDIKVLLFTAEGHQYDVTNMVTDITWSGDINSLPRQADLSIQNSADISGNGSILVSYDVGTTLSIYKDGEEIFHGWIQKVSRNEKGEENVSAYDHLIFATKSEETMLVKDKKASDVADALLHKFGIQKGRIEDTGYKIPKEAFTGETIGEIITKCLEKTKENTGRDFVLSSWQNFTTLVARENAKTYTIELVDMISGTYEKSIENSYNAIQITKGNVDPEEGSEGGEGSEKVPFDMIHVWSQEHAERYGYMVKTESIEDDEKATRSDMYRLGNQKLEELKRPTETLDVDFYGDVRCRTGNKVIISNGVLGAVGEYFITADSHSFSNGVHKMSLQLSRNLGNNAAAPKQRKKMVMAEDESWVPLSFYEGTEAYDRLNEIFETQGDNLPPYLKWE